MTITFQKPTDAIYPEVFCAASLFSELEARLDLQPPHLTSIGILGQVALQRHGRFLQ